MTRIATITAVTLLLLTADSDPLAGKRADILWDEWGVPHIYARSDDALMRGLGWAQMGAHGEWILRQTGIARGEAAGYWGRDYLSSDRLVRRLGIPERAARWHIEQRPATRDRITAFVAGMNRYAERNRDSFPTELTAVLPIVAEDVLAHLQRVFHFADMETLGPDGAPGSDLLGSNAWALGGSRSVKRGATLMGVPHLPFDGTLRLFEVHLIHGERMLYGAVPVGLPMVLVGFNERMGWTHTDNGNSGKDFYELTLHEGGYRFGDEIRAFTTTQESLRFKRADGSFGTERFDIRVSEHGPVIFSRGDRAVAVRATGLDRPHLLDQYWQMGWAGDVNLLEKALALGQSPRFSTIAADASGDILYCFGGLNPRREGMSAPPVGFLDGADPEQLWTEVLAHEELPRLVNPPSGWLQNTNDPPWSVTGTAELDPKRYPPYLTLSSGPSPRAVRSRELITKRGRMTVEDVLEIRFDSRLEQADRLLPHLLEAAWQYGNGWGKQAYDLLYEWDRTLSAESRGGPVFVTWLAKMVEIGFEPGHDPSEENPFDPRVAAELLNDAAYEVYLRHGAVGIPWGEIHRYRIGEVDLPASGGGELTGSFLVTHFARDDDGIQRAVGGESFSFIASFGARLDARVLQVPGNASGTGRARRADQLDLLTRGRMRTPPLDHAGISAVLVERQTLH